MKRVLTLLLVVCMVVSFAACGGKTDTNTPDTNLTNSGSNTNSDTNTDSGSKETAAASVKDTLNVSYSQDRGTLNPMYNMGYDILNAIRLCYDGLWDWDSDGNQIWMLATGMEMEDEGRTWIVHLREGITFSNGNTFNADDVLFTLDKANHREGEPDYFPDLDLDNTYAIDDYTVSIALHNYDMSYSTSITSMMIMDKESFDETDIMTNPIGTGPYKLVDYVVNSHIKFEARDDYWGTPGGIKHINFYLYTEDSQKTNGLETGAIDICDVPFQDLDYVSDFEDYTVQLGDTAMSQTRTLYFNTTENSQAFYNNPDARRAVALAIDREAIVDIAYSGYAKVARAPVSATCIDITEDMLDYGIYGIGYYPEQAKELAISSGLVDQTISISTNGTSSSITIAECIQSDLNAIGIMNVNINNYDSGSWLSIAFDPTACGDMLVDFTGVPSKTVAQNMSAWYLYHLGGGFTFSPFEGKERYEELIDGIMAIVDANELASRYTELIHIHSDALLWYSLCDMTSAFAYNSNIEGFRVMRMGHIDYPNMTWIG